MILPKPFKGYSLATVSYLTQAIGAICSKALIDASSMEATATFWYASGTVISFLLLLCRKGGLKWQSIRRNLSVYLQISLIMTVASVGWFVGLRLAGPGLVAFMQQLATVMGVLMGAFILGERITLLDGIGATLAVTGALLITYRSEQAVIWGILAALFNAAGLAMQNFLVKRHVQRIDDFELLFVRSLTAAIAIPLFFWFTSGIAMPAAWLLPAFFVSSFVGYVLFNLLVYASLAYADLAKVSVLRVITPPASMIGAYLVFNTVPTQAQLGGGVLILIGVSFILVQPLLGPRTPQETSRSVCNEPVTDECPGCRS